MEKSRQTPSARRIVGMVVGIVIIGLGIALFKQSHLGNDSISALNMRLAEMLGISLGVQNLCTNILFFAVQFWFGRKYIGLGTFVNGIGVGFIITAFYEPIAAYFGPAEAAGPCRCSCCGWRWRFRSRRWARPSTRRQTLALRLMIICRWACGTTRPSRTSGAVFLPTPCVRSSAGCWAALWASERSSAHSALGLSSSSSMALSPNGCCSISRKSSNGLP